MEMIAFLKTAEKKEKLTNKIKIDTKSHFNKDLYFDKCKICNRS